MSAGPPDAADTSRRGDSPAASADPARLADVDPTAPERAEAAISELVAGAARWRSVDEQDRLALLDRVRRSVRDAAPAWVWAVASAARDVPTARPAGADWPGGLVPVVRTIDLLRRSVEDIDRHGTSRPLASGTRPDGRVVVDVHPVGRLDRAAMAGITAQAYMRPGVSPADGASPAAATAGSATAAAIHGGGARRDGGGRGPDVSLVRARGGFASAAPMDVLHELFVRDRTVLVELGPRLAHLGPHIGEAFAPLVSEGLLRVVYGGTGSSVPDTSAELVIAGGGPVTTTAVAGGHPIPVIVVPGPWSDRDVRRQAARVAGSAMLGGCSCSGNHLLVTHRSWAKRRELVDGVRVGLSGAAGRAAGCQGDCTPTHATLGREQSARRVGPEADDSCFTLVAGIDGDEDAALFGPGAHCGVVAEAVLDSPRSVPTFIDAAVEFCNVRVSGALGASIVVHPRSLLDAAVSLAVERAVDELGYGVVVVNQLPELAYGLASTPWGSAPDRGLHSDGSSDGATHRDGSGRNDRGTPGFSHNTFMLEGVDKAVVRAPFRSGLPLLWSLEHRRTHRILPTLRSS